MNARIGECGVAKGQSGSGFTANQKIAARGLDMRQRGGSAAGLEDVNINIGTTDGNGLRRVTQDFLQPVQISIISILGNRRNREVRGGCKGFEIVPNRIGAQRIGGMVGVQHEVGSRTHDNERFRSGITTKLIVTRGNQRTGGPGTVALLATENRREILNTARNEGTRPVSVIVQLKSIAENARDRRSLVAVNLAAQLCRTAILQCPQAARSKRRMTLS